MDTLLTRISVECACGGYVTPNALYVSNQKKLVIEGFCIACTNSRLIGISLTELMRLSLKLLRGETDGAIRATTTPPLSLPAGENNFTEDDRKLLAEIEAAFKEHDNEHPSESA